MDANLNRAAEGLRTLEDAARLVREDAVSARELKELRHALAAAASHLSRDDRLTARSLLTDAGTQVTVAAESSRSDMRSVVTSACERVIQSLRCCEEFSKLVDSESAARFKQLRYEAYDRLAKIELRMTRHAWLETAALCVLIDCGKPLSEFSDYLAKLAGAGVTCIQLREKRLEDAHLLRYAEVAMDRLADSGTALVVNDRVDVALAVSAAGVHVGQEDLPLAAVRRLVGHRMCIGVSTHTLEQAIEAERGGADYIGCGPTFASRTKQFDAFAGLDFLKAVAGAVTLPAYAIGGIDSSNADQVARAGIHRAAVSAAVHDAPDPAAEVAMLLQRLQ
ncbi:MAG: thiamine phosphate synthase [Pirellulales bacterium]